MLKRVGSGSPDIGETRVDARPDDVVRAWFALRQLVQSSTLKIMCYLTSRGKIKLLWGPDSSLRAWCNDIKRAMTTLSAVLEEVRQCTLCSAHLPLGPRPVVQAATTARILIVGQAPGTKVHASGIPFDDASGDRLRDWMGISTEIFYDPARIALVPMGFCYPGTGKSGDLPPRPECAPAWREKILSQLKQIELTLVIGQYAQQYHLPGAAANLTELVRAWRSVGPDLIPLPHPSPRNNIWLKRNPWFEQELLPELKLQVRRALG